MKTPPPSVDYALQQTREYVGHAAALRAKPMRSAADEAELERSLSAVVRWANKVKLALAAEREGR